MARDRNRLTARSVGAIDKPGLHGDGDGLYLKVLASGSRSWVFRYRRAGRRIDMGLGPWPTVSLKDARSVAHESRALLVKGLDPLATRRAAHADALADEWTFGAFADDYVAGLEGTFRSAKHFKQWKRAAESLAAPLRKLRLSEITTEDILACLKPHWRERPETARRFQNRLEKILDAAAARGLRRGENPARWRGHLDALLPDRPSGERPHHTAMDWRNVPNFMTRLAEEKSLSARLLELIVLTAVRTGEARSAHWDEFDLDEALWRIPPARMKAAREHIVPLSPQVISVMKDLQEFRTGPLVFPGRIPGAPLSHVVCQRVLNRMDESCTTHGFRSSFRDFAGDMTEAPREVAEAALSHAGGDRVEAAYRRGTALERRRILMCQWADYILPLEGKAKIVSIGSGRNR